jgi:hypothetical protein
MSIDFTATRVTLDGDALQDHYQIASLTLAFARGSDVARESSWALALAAGTLVSCVSENATLCIERGDSPGSIRIRLAGTWAPDTEETVAQIMLRLQELGFATQRGEGELLLSLGQAR